MEKALINKNGITVKQLKDYLKDWPDKNSAGEDNEVWMWDNGTSNTINVAMRLNESDIILEKDA